MKDIFEVSGGDVVRNNFHAICAGSSFSKIIVMSLSIIMVASMLSLPVLPLPSAPSSTDFSDLMLF